MPPNHVMSCLAFNTLLLRHQQNGLKIMYCSCVPHLLYLILWCNPWVISVKIGQQCPSLIANIYCHYIWPEQYPTGIHLSLHPQYLAYRRQSFIELIISYWCPWILTSSLHPKLVALVVLTQLLAAIGFGSYCGILR